MRSHIVFLFLLLSLILGKVSASPDSQVYFRHLGSHVGLPGSGAFYSIIQDKNGFMWMATNRGLVRYDGSSAKMYNISSNKGNDMEAVLYLELDAFNRLWMRTMNGIFIYDISRSEYSQFRPVYKDKCLDNISHFSIQNDGHLLFLSSKKLYECDTLTRQCRLIPTDLPDGEQEYAPAVFRDNQGVLRIGYPHKGIYRVDMSRGPQLIGEHEHTPLKFYDYDKDSIFICTLSRGLWIMSKRTGESRKVSVPDMADDNIFASVCCKIDDSRWWIGSETGIYVLQNGCITQHFTHYDGDMFSLSDDKILSLFVDSNNGIWVGTEKGGLNYCKMDGGRFHRYYPSHGLMSLHGHHVSAIAESNDGVLWVGTDDGGLNCVAIDGKTDVGKYDWVLRNEQLRSIIVTDLMMVGDELWISSYTTGLFVVNLTDKSVRNYRKNNEVGCITNNEDNCMCVDANGDVWIGTTTEIFRFDRTTDRFSSASGQIAWITDMVIDDDNCLWASTLANGLIKYDIDTGKLDWVRHKDNDPGSICGGRLSSLYLDHRGYLWIGSDGNGLTRMSLKNYECRQMGVDEGLPSGYICSMLEDSDGQMWVSTTAGLTLVDVDEWKVQSIWRRGVWPIDEEFSPRACLLLKNGEVAMGGTYGFISFYPHVLTRGNDSFRPMVTDIFFPLERGREGSYVIKDDYIELPYSMSTFGVRLSALDYVNDNSGTFEYMLQGSGVDEWMRCESQPIAQWSKLSPGTYELLVRYASDGRNWSDNISVLKIRILPPWWRSWWAYLIYVVLALVVAWYVWKYVKQLRKAKLLKQKRLWEEQRKEETMEARMNFFTNIAHEIRTPVSLIRASVEQMSEGGGDNVRAKERLLRNTESLGRLVDELLEFRRVESEVKVLGKTRVDLSRTLKVTVDAFGPAIKKNGLSLDINDGMAQTYVWGDEQALHTVLTNLMSNAVKYADRCISIRINREKDRVLLRMWNDGNPISEDVCEHIFEPFVKGESTENSTGIGLSLVHLLVKRMDGDITVDTGNEGTEFCVRLLSADTAVESFDVGNTDSGDMCVMIVEDNNDMRNYLSEQFSERYKVVTAADGVEAWDILANTNVELIVSDVMMPGMDGFELCSKVKTTMMTSHIPIVLLTAKTTETEHVKGYAIGADAYVDKPFSIKELLAISDSIIRNRMLSRQRFRVSNIAQEDDSKQNSDMQEVWTNDLDRMFDAKLNEYVSDHLSDEDFNIDALAEFMNMSRSNFHRKMKALYDSTPGEYIHIMRMKRAASLLSIGTYRVGEVSEMVGFHSVAHFTRVFKKQFGVLPKKFMDSRKKG